MKVKELIKKLEALNPHKHVYLSNEDGDYDYYIAYSALNKTINVLDQDEEVVVIDFK